MTKEIKSRSEFQQRLKAFRYNEKAWVALWVLVALYAAAVFADFLSPYSYKNEDRSFSYCPPSQICLIKDGWWSWPYIHGVNVTYDELNARVYKKDFNKIYPVRLMIKGDEYRFLGLFKTSIHFFGVEAPGRIFILGADSRGRDIFSRILYGSRISLSIGIIGVVISFVLGMIVGGIAGYCGGWVDNLLMRICEMLMMVPGFYLLLAFRAAVPDTFNSVQTYIAIVIIFSMIGWPSLARIIRGMCLTLRERDYVLAAKLMGVSHFKIITTHLLPHTVSYTIFAVMLAIPGYILGESALSLIGLGIQDPYASWGNMLTDAMSIVRIQIAPWILWPVFFIFVAVLCFNVIGDALRDCLDPKLSLAKETNS